MKIKNDKKGIKISYIYQNNKKNKPFIVQRKKGLNNFIYNLKILTKWSNSYL